MKNIFLSINLSLASLIGAVAIASPAQVFIMRHGEKPTAGDNLDAQGYQRATGLPAFFASTTQLKQFGPPVAIYAMAPSNTDSSNRPVETVAPLAKALGIQINSSFTKLQIVPLVTQIMNSPAYNNKSVLICWEHTMIPQIAKDFGATMAPQAWDGNVFNQIWVLSLAGNRVINFNSLLETILPSDRSF